ncbi:class III peroxidase [Medicago truncatula]|uniref:Peroxidase n=1 Tax=Medicago truncatula TaxID=3880 RepID=A0A072UJD7_MEDTR|nr:class III peroxidase [Medicago truncatula]
MGVFTRSMVTFCVLICLIGIVSASSVIPSATTYVSNLIPGPSSELRPSFYLLHGCPLAVQTIRTAITTAVLKDPRLGASLLRLHFQDCFVQGCDASVLLKDTPTFKGEQNARPNANSLRGYEIIESVKAQLELLCPNVVSCADILALAARDSVVALGGPNWLVRLGRRDSTTADFNAANSDLPSPFLDLDGLIAAFKKKGFTAEEMVALSGAHTIGKAKCGLIRNRIYNESNIDPNYAKSLQAFLPCPKSGGDNNLASLDATTPNFFDNAYYRNLLNKKGLLHSDQQLYNGGSTDYKVSAYANNPLLFSIDFANAMIKMGNLSPLTGDQGQIRKYCSRVNY